MDPQKSGVPQPAVYNNVPNSGSSGAPLGPPPAYSSNQSTVVIQTQPNYCVLTQTFGETPCRTKCQSCHCDIMTSTHYETGTITYVVCLVLCFIGLYLFCCLIPFCLNSCKDVVHTCPNCRFTVGRYNRM